MKINKLNHNSQIFKNRLSRLHDPPGQIYYRGKVNEDSVTLAIVGTRKPTEYGKNVVKYICENLAGTKLNIVSGLAYGIDSYAHQYAIENRLNTTAVVAGELTRPYPKGNHRLANMILGNGAIISEDIKSGLRKHDFLKRNRLIAALSDLVIIVEAASRSGSINTAMHALDIGVSVWAVPGDILSKQSAGTNKLIDQGATPLHDINLLKEELGIKTTTNRPALNNKYATLIYKYIERQGASSLDQVCEGLSLDIDIILPALTELELAGSVHVRQGKYYTYN